MLREFAMSHRIGRLDQTQRAHEKQVSRDRDAARLASGEVDDLQLRRENGFFSALPLNRFQVVAIGDVPVRHPGKRIVR